MSIIERVEFFESRQRTIFLDPITQNPKIQLNKSILDPDRRIVTQRLIEHPNIITHNLSLAQIIHRVFLAPQEKHEDRTEQHLQPEIIANGSDMQEDKLHEKDDLLIRAHTHQHC